MGVKCCLNVKNAIPLI